MVIGAPPAEPVAEMPLPVAPTAAAVMFMAPAPVVFTASMPSPAVPVTSAVVVIEVWPVPLVEVLTPVVPLTVP